ncbi:MAG: ferredoxin family protein [Candidatus Glassbacteria bacterium]
MKYWRKPLDKERIKKPVGEIHVLKDRCKGCSFCIEYCPRNVLDLSQEFNEKGYHFPVAARAEDCVDCKLCQNICPEFAIYVLTENGGETESDDQK